MSYVAINYKNVLDYPVGTVVEFNYGPMNGSERGIVTGYRVTSFGTELEARTEKGETKFISGFSDIGIGVYLISIPSRKNTNSPWYVAA